MDVEPGPSHNLTPRETVGGYGAHLRPGVKAALQGERYATGWRRYLTAMDVLGLLALIAIVTAVILAG